MIRNIYIYICTVFFKQAIYLYMPFTTGALLCTNIWTYSVSELLLICVSLYGLNDVSFLMPRPVSVHFSVSTFLLEPCPLKISHQSHNNHQTTEEKMFRLGAENKLPELTQENKFLGSCRISNSLDQDCLFFFFSTRLRSSVGVLVVPDFLH